MVPGTKLVSVYDTTGPKEHVLHCKHPKEGGMSQQTRYIGLDVHKNFIMVAAVTKQQEILLKPRRIAMKQFQEWAHDHLHANDAVAFEASGNAWWVFDILSPVTTNLVVANAHKIKLISSGNVKTDRQDALILAKLLAANLLPEVWVPPKEVRELRTLINHRKQLVKRRTASKNRLHSVLYRHAIELPEGGAFSQKNQEWWKKLNIPISERLRVKHDYLQILQVEEMINEVDEALAGLSIQNPWREQIPFLIQFTGIGLVSAMTILGAIGDITRFPSAKKLVGYSGLGTRVYSSGNTHRSGGINKAGRRELRSTLIECAWSAVNHSSYWQEQYERLSKRTGNSKAITAISRKILVAIWHVLSKKEANLHENPERVVRSLMKWASTYCSASRQGMKRPEFVRWGLELLGMNYQQGSFMYGNKKYRLPAHVTS